MPATNFSDQFTDVVDACALAQALSTLSMNPFLGTRQGLRRCQPVILLELPSWT